MTSIEKEAQEVSALVPKLITGVKGSLMLSEDVTPQQMVTILAVSEVGVSKVGIISKKIGVSAPTLTGLIDRLQRNGYVKRFRDTEDRRIVFVSLTKKGYSYVKKFKKIIQRRWRQILVHLTEEERIAYIKILRKLVKAFTEKAE